MSLSTYYLEYGSHLARLHRRRRRRAYAPTSNTDSHDNHEKINSWVSFCFPYEYGAPLGGPSGRRSSAVTITKCRGLTRLRLVSPQHILTSVITCIVVDNTIQHDKPHSICFLPQCQRNEIFVLTIENTDSDLNVQT